MTGERSLVLVEDDGRTRKVLRTLLTAEGWSVTACETAEQALEALANHHFGAIVTDLVLPGISGLELLADPRAHGARPVVISGHDPPQDLDAAIAWLPKPVDLDQLLLALQ